MNKKENGPHALQYRQEPNVFLVFMFVNTPKVDLRVTSKRVV